MDKVTRQCQQDRSAIPYISSWATCTVDLDSGALALTNAPNRPALLQLNRSLGTAVDEVRRFFEGIKRQLNDDRWHKICFSGCGSVCGEMPGRMMAECWHVLSGLTKNILLHCYVTSEIFRILKKNSISKRKKENNLFTTCSHALILSRPTCSLPCWAMAGWICSLTIPLGYFLQVVYIAHKTRRFVERTVQGNSLSIAMGQEPCEYVPLFSDVPACRPEDDLSE